MAWSGSEAVLSSVSCGLGAIPLASTDSTTDSNVASNASAGKSDGDGS